MDWNKEEEKMAVAVVVSLHKLEEFLKQEYPTVWKHWDLYRDVKTTEWAQNLMERINK